MNIEINKYYVVRHSLHPVTGRMHEQVVGSFTEVLAAIRAPGWLREADDFDDSIRYSVLDSTGRTILKPYNNLEADRICNGPIVTASEETDFINACRWARAARDRFNWRVMRNFDLALGLLPPNEAAHIIEELNHGSR